MVCRRLKDDAQFQAAYHAWQRDVIVGAQTKLRRWRIER